MINYDNYMYNEDCVFPKQSRKDRLEKQLGDFGEQIVMTLLGRIAGYSVAYVDHEGADLIAFDPSNQRQYAISVKTAQIGPNENETKVFQEKDQKKLCAFSKDFELIPAVAMLFIPKDFAFIDIYVLTLDAFQSIAEKGETEAIKETTCGLQINNYCLGTAKKNIKHSDGRGYLKYLHNNELIEHVRLDVRNRENFLKGICPVCSDKVGDIKSIERLLSDITDSDGNLSRQLGEGGEYFLMMLLGQQKGYKVARVDHVGADLIATDKSGEKYAISVKTVNAKSYEFYELYTNAISVKNPKNELGKLQDFADKFHMTSVVACIFVKPNFDGIDIFVSTLKNWMEKGFEDSTNAISMSTKLYDGERNISNWQEWLNTMKINITKNEQYTFLDKAEGIEHVEINYMSKFDSDYMWDMKN